MCALMAASTEACFGTYKQRDFSKNSRGKSKSELMEDKGLKSYDFHFVNGVPMFSCFAINQKSAEKKYRKWLSNGNK